MKKRRLDATRDGEEGNFKSDRIELPRRKEHIQIPRSYTSRLDSVTSKPRIACGTVMNEIRGMIQ